MTFASFKKQKFSSQSGNILIYILGAIFLLGLLIITVRGSSTPGSNIAAEELIMRINEVQQYGAELENAVSFILQKGYSEADIRFAHPDAAAGYGLITDIPDRQVFAREGGGATYRAPPNNIQVIATDWLFTGENNIPAIGSTNNANTDLDVELIAILQNVSEAFCIALNDKNGINPTPADPPPEDDGNVALGTPFAGTFSMVQTIGDTGNLLDGNAEGCFEGGGTPANNTYHYYRVLLVR